MSSVPKHHLYILYSLLTLSILMGALSLTSLYLKSGISECIHIPWDFTPSSQALQDSNSQPQALQDSNSQPQLRNLNGQSQALQDSNGQSQLRNSNSQSQALQDSNSQSQLRNPNNQPQALQDSNSQSQNSILNWQQATSKYYTMSNRRDRMRRNAPRETTSETQKRKGKAKKTSNKFQGLPVIHLMPKHTDRTYESGPKIPLSTHNASDTRGTVYNFWRKASWVPDSIDKVLYLDEISGHVTVEIEGIYMIYAQVVYHDLSGRWSFGINVNNEEKAKCLATEQLKDLHLYHPTSHGVYQSCYTAVVVHIRKNQSVSIHCMYGTRTILTSPEFTFWGVIRLA